MPRIIDGRKLYQTAEACRRAGTNRMTFLKWVRQNKFEDVPCRDLNGWRLFAEEDIRRLRDRVNQVRRVQTTRER